MDVSGSFGPGNRPNMGGAGIDVSIGRGKAGAVGQLAKQAVSEARATGAELPSNAQGLAASQIAKGADPATIFAALVTPDVPVDSGDEAGGSNDTPPVAPVDTPTAEGFAPTDDASPPDAVADPEPVAGPDDVTDDSVTVSVPSAETVDDATASALVAQIETAYAEALLGGLATPSSTEVDRVT